MIIALILSLLVLVGFSFPAFVQDNFIIPLALVLLLCWRIVQSVDQQIYWVVLIFTVMLYVLVRVYRSLQGSDDFDQTQSPDVNTILQQIRYWRTSIRLIDFTHDSTNSLERDMAKMLAALYASKQNHMTQYEIYSALEQHQIPLPEPVYKFLFPARSSGAKRSLKQLLRSLEDMPRQQIRRWTGREKAEYYQRLDQALKFMESVMENEHDIERFDAYHD